MLEILIICVVAITLGMHNSPPPSSKVKPITIEYNDTNRSIK